LKRNKTYLSIVVAAFLILGCDWNPPRDNPLDPGNYRHEPVGSLQLLVLATGSTQVLADADIQIPALNRFTVTDDSGFAQFDDLPTGGFWVLGEKRRGLPYGIDSTFVVIRENRLRTDTLQLHAQPLPTGSLLFRTLDRTQQSISGVSVTITALGLFVRSDGEGVARFEDLPPGDWWVSAEKSESPGARFGLDSLLVTISSLIEADRSIFLDALPEFQMLTVTSLATSSIGQVDPQYSLRIRAIVTDPDGIIDLLRVEAMLIDTSRDDTIRSSLVFDNDSSLWFTEIPSDSFPGNLIDNALGLPVVVEAFDRAGYRSPAQTRYLTRVIHGVPQLFLESGGATPTLAWIYDLWSEMPSISLFKYQVRIYHNNIQRIRRYLRTVVPEQRAYNQHIVDTELPPGPYIWEVWVLDNFGNSSRSAPGYFTVQ
jgi:hypothetical protein